MKKKLKFFCLLNALIIIFVLSACGTSSHGVAVLLEEAEPNVPEPQKPVLISNDYYNKNAFTNSLLNKTGTFTYAGSTDNVIVDTDGKLKRVVKEYSIAFASITTMKDYAIQDLGTQFEIYDPEKDSAKQKISTTLQYSNYVEEMTAWEKSDEYKKEVGFSIDFFKFGGSYTYTEKNSGSKTVGASESFTVTYEQELNFAPHYGAGKYAYQFRARLIVYKPIIKIYKKEYSQLVNNKNDGKYHQAEFSTFFMYSFDYIEGDIFYVVNTSDKNTMPYVALRRVA